MDLQAEKLKDFLVKTIRKNSAILWLIGTTFAAFMIYVGILTFLFVYMLNPESGECFSPVCAEIIFFGSVLILWFLPLVILRWRKICISKKATFILSLLCGIASIFDFLYMGISLILIESGTFYEGGVPLENLFVGIAPILFIGNLVRISLLISLLGISENRKRLGRGLFLAVTIFELAALPVVLFMVMGSAPRGIKTEYSPDGSNSISFLPPPENDKCFVLKADGQIFYTKASIYHNTKWEWQGNDRFILKSSDVGDIEFRKENGVWKAAPESLIRKKRM